MTVVLQVGRRRGTDGVGRRRGGPGPSEVLEAISIVWAMTWVRSVLPPEVLRVLIDGSDERRGGITTGAGGLLAGISHY